jgi:TPP-dependent 2-oxoacid decarboxylase
VSPDFTVADYLVLRLKEIGVDHLFGVPGDFVLGILNQVLKSDVAYVGTCNELNAAYAADGYARIRGVGAFASTYGVGELSALNGVAGAWAERVPVVAVTGSPSMDAFRDRPLLHHTLGDYQIPLRMYEKITAASAHLASAKDAPAEIDRVLAACLARQQPVYLSLPADVARQACARPGPFPFPGQAPTDPAALAEAVGEAAALLDKATAPMVIGDVELIRFKLEDQFAALLHRTGYPFTTRMLGKAVLSERHPQFIGLFEGDRSRPYVRERVAQADGVLQLGAWMTDFNTGGFTAALDQAKTVSASLGGVRIGHHLYENVGLGAFIQALTARLPPRRAGPLEMQSAADHGTHRSSQPYVAASEEALTVKRLFDRLVRRIPEGAIVVAETGVSLFSAAEMVLPDGAAFIGQTFYGSIGYTVGAALGAAVAAPGRKVVLFIGDGAFQVTGQDLSTMIRHGAKPLIVLLNNGGYTIERVISDHPYNDLQPWAYHRLPEVFGGGLGLEARSEGELETALAQASAADGLVLLEAHTGRLDCPEALREAGRSMAKTNFLD